MNKDHGLTPAVVARAQLPASYAAVVAALEQCEALDECREWSDKAAALASYARQAKDETLLATAMRIRARAVRRVGELIGQIKPARGGDRRSPIKKGVVLPFESPRATATREAGLSSEQAKAAVRVAAVPPPEFERLVEAPKPASIAALAAAGTKHRMPSWPAPTFRPEEFQTHRMPSWPVPTIRVDREEIPQEPQAGKRFLAALEEHLRWLHRQDVRAVKLTTGERRRARKVAEAMVFSYGEIAEQLRRRAPAAG